jgi:hypothetical protein
MQKTTPILSWKTDSSPRFKILFPALLSIFLCVATFAQKQVERLGRGVVAVRTSTSQVYVGWRLLGTDPSGIAFNVYRGSTKVNATPITNSTNYVDNVSTNSTYTVRPVINGVEQAASAGASVWGQQYLSVNLQVPPPGRTPPYTVVVGGVTESYPNGQDYTYSPNDCSPGDLDGDGEYEIVVLWNPSNARDNSQSGFTGNVYIDAYKLNGTRLWRIDLGRNIRAGAHYTQLMVFDLDGDNKAEVAVKTADGTRSGTGQVIGSSTADYRNSDGYILSGPEFLTIFNGQTGAAMATTNFVPARGTVSDWGDSKGNRVDRFVSTIAYVDGSRPSLIMGRGYYTRLVRTAWDWRNGALTRRWTFDSNNNSSYFGEGNHQLSVADGNGDGRHDIYNGSSTVSGTGSGLYSNGLGHGDALHVSDMNPDRPGQEVWMCHEEASSNGGIGLSLTDGRTGARIFTVPGTGDVGRGVAADIDSRYKGFECWGSTGGLYTVTGTQITTTKPSMNHLLWWDGDVQRELLDGTKLDKWVPSSNSVTRLMTFYNYGTATQINGSKANPNVSADILGDWREEVVFHSSDNTKLLIFTTTIPAANRFYTFMHDAQYRCQVAGQTSAYNQPPHTSFYFGGGMAAPPTPSIYLAGSGTTTPPSGTISGTYTITARHSGKALDVEGRSLVDGGNVIQWTSTGGTNQQWNFTHLGDGYYRLTNVNSGKALEVAGSSTANGGNIQQSAWTGAYNQHWQVNNLGGGYYSIINRNSGKAADVAAASTADGANVAQYTYGGGTNQQFGLGSVSSAARTAANSEISSVAPPDNIQTSVYPNPSRGAFNLNSPGKFTFRILDPLGKVTEQGQGINKTQAGGRLPAGVYSITITNNGKTETFKAVKL